MAPKMLDGVMVKWERRLIFVLGFSTNLIHLLTVSCIYLFIVCFGNDHYRVMQASMDRMALLDWMEETLKLGQGAHMYAS